MTLLTGIGNGYRMLSLQYEVRNPIYLVERDLTRLRTAAEVGCAFYWLRDIQVLV